MFATAAQFCSESCLGMRCFCSPIALSFAAIPHPSHQSGGGITNAGSGITFVRNVTMKNVAAGATGGGILTVGPLAVENVTIYGASAGLVSQVRRVCTSVSLSA